jgi:hypothetical protein
MKPFIFVLLITLASPGYADLDFTLSYHAPSHADLVSAPQYEVRWGKDVYLWGSLSKHTQVAQTQRIGDVRLLGLGGGYHQTFRGVTLYAEAGMGKLFTRYDTRVLKEVAYYSFSPIFGQPPFLPAGGWWTDLEQVYEPDPVAPLFRIGALIPVSHRVSIELSYLRWATSVYFSTWNPHLNGGPVTGNYDACGCLWEGQTELNLSGLSLGLNYQF